MTANRKSLRKLGAFFVLVLFLSFPLASYYGIRSLRECTIDSNRIIAWWLGAEFLGTEGVVFQENRNDCGPAALKMALDRLGIKSEINELAKIAGTTETGTTMLGLKKAAEQKGVTAEGWRYTWNDFRKSPLPAVVFVDGHHYMTVIEFKDKETLILLDPATGKLRMNRKNFLKIWKGETLTIKKKFLNDGRTGVQYETAVNTGFFINVLKMNSKTDKLFSL